MEYTVISLNNLGYEDKYKTIYDNMTIKNKENFFIDKKDALVIAAILGINNFSKVDIEEYQLDKIRPLVVDFKEYYPIIYSIAISFSQKSEIIFDKGKVTEIFNKCAGLGIAKLIEILEREGDVSIKNYEDFLKKPNNYLNFNKLHNEKNEILEINEQLEEASWL